MQAVFAYFEIRDNLSQLITNPAVVVSSIDSDPPMYQPRLIRHFLCVQKVAKRTLVSIHTKYEDPGQTGGMPRPVQVLTGCMCHYVDVIIRDITVAHNIRLS